MRCQFKNEWMIRRCAFRRNSVILMLNDANSASSRPIKELQNSHFFLKYLLYKIIPLFPILYCKQIFQIQINPLCGKLYICPAMYVFCFLNRYQEQFCYFGACSVKPVMQATENVCHMSQIEAKLRLNRKITIISTYLLHSNHTVLVLYL